jgi:hypothetical protein
VLSQESPYCARSVYASIIVHEHLLAAVIRQETFAQRLYVALGAVSIICSIRIALYNNLVAFSSYTTFI